MTHKFCTQCGKKLLINDKFCYNCGQIQQIITKKENGEPIAQITKGDIKEVKEYPIQNTEKDSQDSEEVIEKVLPFKNIFTQQELTSLEESIKKISTPKRVYIGNYRGSNLHKIKTWFSIDLEEKDIFAFIDAASFCNSKGGIIFTYDKIYYNFWNDKFIIAYKDLSAEKMENAKDKQGNRVGYFYCNDNVSHKLNIKEYNNAGIEFAPLMNSLSQIIALFEQYDLVSSNKQGNSFEGSVEAILSKYQSRLVRGNVYLKKNMNKELFNKINNKERLNLSIEQCYMVAQCMWTIVGSNVCLITFWGIYSITYSERAIIYFRDIEKVVDQKSHALITLKNGSVFAFKDDNYHIKDLVKVLKSILRLYEDLIISPNKYNLESASLNYREILLSFKEDLALKEVTWLNEQYKIGNPYATLELAKRYRNGTGVSKDVTKAADLLQEYAYAEDYRMLGEMYFNGELGTADTQQAEKYFSKAKELGDLEAEVFIANFYFMGINRGIDYNMAFILYKELADKIPHEKLPHCVKANIGLCYKYGYGCEVSYKEAVYWLDQVKHEEDFSKYLLADIYVTDPAYSHKVEEGISYLEVLVEKRNAFAMAKLGALYFLGLHVETNYERACLLLEQTSEQGQVEAHYYLALMNVLKCTKKSDTEEAFVHMEYAADKGYVPAMRDLALMYQYGIGVGKNINQAKIWFDKATHGGDAYAAQWRENTQEFNERIRQLNEVAYAEDEEVKAALCDAVMWNNDEEEVSAFEKYSIHQMISKYPIVITRLHFEGIRKEEQEQGRVKSSMSRTSSIQGAYYTASVTKHFAAFRGVQAHGAAGEYANHVSDLLKFRDARWLGPDNALHGADRVVNGQLIQTKYYSTRVKDPATGQMVVDPTKATNSIAACFDKGQALYIDSETGKMMQIEVPKDQYNDAIKKIEQRIASNEVPGETNTENAKNYVKKGSVTTIQAENIARFGNIDSLVCDAKMGVVTARNAMAITVAISYATSVWNGESLEVATQRAVETGLKTFGVAFCSSVITLQASKTAFVQGMKISDKMVSDKITKLLSRASGQKTALTKTMAKNVLKSNIVGTLATSAVLSSVDIARLINGRISKEQLFKNVTVTTVSVATSSAGFVVGAACGSIIPVVGTFIGGMIGASLAGMGAGKIASLTMDNYIKNDGDYMLEIFNTTFMKMAKDYLLSKDEVEYIITCIQQEHLLSDNEMRNIYASDHREAHCYQLILVLIEEVCQLRQFVVTPKMGALEREILHVIDIEDYEVTPG